MLRAEKAEPQYGCAWTSALPCASLSFRELSNGTPHMCAHVHELKLNYLFCFRIISAKDYRHTPHQVTLDCIKILCANNTDPILQQSIHWKLSPTFPRSFCRRALHTGAVINHLVATSENLTSNILSCRTQMCSRCGYPLLSPSCIIEITKSFIC